jgi:Lrp/AsnC family leucine-responsive transcriptional regulator
MAELGRRISLSPPAVAERVQRLERTGVITGYRAVIDPKAVGYPIAAVIRVRPASGRLPRIAELARETPEVVDAIASREIAFLKSIPLIDDLEAISITSPTAD